MSVEQRGSHRPLRGEEPSTMAQMQEAERLLLQFQGLFGKPESNSESVAEAGAADSGGKAAQAKVEERPMSRLRPPATPALATTLPPTSSAPSSSSQVAPAEPPASSTGLLTATTKEGLVVSLHLSAVAPTVPPASSVGPLTVTTKAGEMEDGGVAVPASSASGRAGIPEAVDPARVPQAPGTLVLRGGGVRCAAYAGLIRRLEEGKMLSDVVTLIGISGGAQVAALLAFGYSGQELEDALRQPPRRKLLDYAGFPCGACRNFFRLFWHYGVCKGSALEGHLDGLFAQKFGRKRCTFRQLYERTGKELQLGVCNMVTRELEFLDRHSHPDMPVCVAARASSSMPILFRPVRVAKALYVDGGIARKMPASNLEAGEQVLACILLSTEGRSPTKPPANFIQFLKASLSLLQDIQDVDACDQRPTSSDQAFLDAININIGQVDGFDIDAAKGDFDELVKLGYEAASEYLRPTTE
uniref:PNPLA domain-containing protein n=1 Tax=Alexandrium monilatum TaxID=311494 RepID=A0A7S4Q6H6_9DINO